MARHRQRLDLRVYLSNRLVGTLRKEASGAVEFRYDETWLAWEHALPVSLSLPLREDAWRGAPVIAVFENLLPDSDALRRRVAERVGARGTDAVSLLAAIGHDCVGALRFLPTDEPPADDDAVTGEPLTEEDIERLLNGLARAPLGLEPDDAFRISVAGAQEKTALLWHEGRWWKPHGATPTTHLFKPPIGKLPGGYDLSDSVENEFYCLKLCAAFGLPVASAEMHAFGNTKALVIERFDRRWAKDGRLLRLPQEDFCQALGVPPSLKYQSEGGPGLADILTLLRGSETPAEDQKTVLKAQLLFWLMGATDGHAKNFSIHLGRNGRFRLTPLYDILTTQPLFDAGQIERKGFKLALSVGDKNRYRLDEICGRHFFQTAAKARVPEQLVRGALEEMAAAAEPALEQVTGSLPPDFPVRIHASVSEAIRSRLRRL